MSINDVNCVMFLNIVIQHVEGEQLRVYVHFKEIKMNINHTDFKTNGILKFTPVSSDHYSKINKKVN